MIRSLLSFLGLVAAIAFGFGIWLFLLRGDDRLPGTRTPSSCWPEATYGCPSRSA